RAATRWDATVHQFPVPAFFDYPATREAMWRERSVQRVLATQREATVAVFSVGAFDAEVPSHVYTHNYLTEQDLRSLRADGAVGDVCTVFLRADGTWRDIAMNHRGSGTAPDRLLRIPRRLLVASGSRKALPLRAALRAGVATDVVVDEVTARSLIALRWPRGPGAPHPAAPHRTAPHRTAPHRTAPHRTAPHRTARLSDSVPFLAESGTESDDLPRRR